MSIQTLFMAAVCVLEFNAVETSHAGTITSTNSFRGTVGVAFSNMVIASGSGNTFGGSNLPVGLTIATNGLISGTPSQAGTNIATLWAYGGTPGTGYQTNTFIIAKSPPTLTWAPSPAASLTYPAPLTSTQLNATSSVAGTFSYNPTNGTVLNAGTNTLVGTFTPSNTTNYSSGGTITNTVVVAKGTPTISVIPTASSISYSRTLASSTLSGGVASVAGSFAFTTPSTLPPVGTSSQTVTFTPQNTANYNTVTTTVSVTVGNGSQTILFGSLPSKHVGDPAFNLTATATSGLPVTYTSSDVNVATVLGSTVTIVGMGGTTITASQAGDGNWGQAAVVSQALLVTPASQQITGTIRDFRNYTQGGHLDFDRFVGDDRGIVDVLLGSDRKPVYAGNPTTPTTSGKSNFDQWFRNVDGVNLNADLTISLIEDPARPGVYIYDNQNFFPIDGQLQGNGGYAHNFGFTYELHLQFTYRAGDVFKFRGDDDVWVYMNGRRVIDLGGVHGAEEQTVSLDAVGAACGMTPGNSYPLDIFFAERHQTQSSFRIEATMYPIITVPPQTATITLANLLQAYDGTPKAPTITTTPAGLPVTVTYNGQTSVPSAIGRYDIRATLNDPAYQASQATGTLEIYNPIVPGTITLSGLAHTYDRTGKAATATVSPSNATYTVTYNGVTNRPVNAGSYTVVGTLSGNYSGSVTETLVIGAREVGVTGLSVLSRVYDGSTAATISGTPGLVNVAAGDSVAAAGTALGSFVDKNAGTGKIVAVTGLSLTGSGSANYTLGPTVVSGEITKRPVQVVASAGTKVFGESDPVLTYTASPALLTGDNFGGNLEREVGEIAGEYNILQGSLTAGGNYQINFTGAKFTILPRTLLTISGASVNGRDYDGSRAAGVDWSMAELEGVGAGQDVQLVSSGAIATYDSASAGVGKSVSVTGLSLAGADAGRYELGSVLLLSGDILQKALNLSGVTVLEKRYDGSVEASLEWGSHSLSGYVANEGSGQARLALPYGTVKYADAYVGVGKVVAGWFRDPVLEGVGKDNYRLVVPSNLSGTILKGWAGIEIQGTSQVYGGVSRVVSVATTNLVGINPVLEVMYEGINGTVYGPSSSGPTDAGSYAVAAKVSESDNTYEGTASGVLTITRKPAVVTAVSDTIRAGTVFGGTRYTYSSDFLPGDVPAGSLATHLRSVVSTDPLVSYDPAQNQSGVYRILRGSVGENVARNYAIEYREGTLTVLKDSLMTEGTVMPLAAGNNFTLVVQSNRAVSAFGSNSNVVGAVPAILSNGTSEVVGVGSGAGNNFGMAWTRDGQPVVWGITPGSTPAGLTSIGMMAGGNMHVVYLREDGVVGAWGNGASAVTNVPGVLTNSNTAKVVGLAAGENWNVAVRTNGSVVGWGDNTYGQGNTPVLSSAVGVAANNYNGVALNGDGTVVAWGNNTFGGTTIPGELTNRSTNTFVRAVSVVAGYQYNLVLRADGTVRGWGSGSPTNLPSSLTSTMGINPIVSLAVEQHHAVALQRDGTVTTWLPAVPPAESNSVTLTVPAGLKGRVPMGGADSDGDGWANEAELRVGSDPMSRTSQPVKASFGVTFSYGSSGSSFEVNKVVDEGTNRVVGMLKILDTMGRLEDGNQTEMTVELSQESLKTFEPVSRTNRELRFKSSPVYGSTGNSYPVDVIVRDSSSSATFTTTLTVSVGNVAPQITGPSELGVYENVATGTVVGTVQATESNVTWSITSGNGLGLFAIDGQSGEIKTLGAIDYEALGSSNPITLGVRVTDAGGSSGSADVAITVGDVLEGMTPEVWLAGSGVTLTSELLVKYAIGGASTPTGLSESTVTVLDSSKLSLMAVVRTDDLSLSVVGEVGTDLSSWSSIGVSVVPAASQAGVPAGYERLIYSVDRSNSPSRQFMRLSVTR